MSVEEVVSFLEKIPSNVLEYSIYKLLENDIVSFNNISQMYVKSLEQQRKHSKRQLAETDTALMQMLLDHDKKQKNAPKYNPSVERALYSLSHNGFFCVDGLMDKYSYEENRAKGLTNFRWDEK